MNFSDPRWGNQNYDKKNNTNFTNIWAFIAGFFFCSKSSNRTAGDPGGGTRNGGEGT